MQILVDERDYEFFLKVDKFCRNIDPYMEQLSLAAVEVENLKNDSWIFEYMMLEKGPVLFKSNEDQFLRSRLNNMKLAYSNLVQACKNSKSYSIGTGVILGIEVPYYELQRA